MSTYGKIVLGFSILLMGMWQVCWVTDYLGRFDSLSAMGAGFFVGWGLRSLLAGPTSKK